MRRLLLISSFLLPLSLFAEKSAFGAGDLDSPSPYGLTKAEKSILINKEKISNILNTVRENKTRINNVEESLSGIQSLVEGLNETGRNKNLELQTLKEDISQMKESSVEVNQKIDEIILTNEENIKQLKTVMGELSSLIDTINSNYVTKEEYNTLAKEINSFKLEVSKQLKKISAGGNSIYDNKSNAAVAKDAAKMFKNKKYADTIDAYEYLITKHYKPAAAHFYIGESYFQLNEYKNSIAYFKKSNELYSKASYMPKLMLHTGIALDKTKSSDSAQQFFQALIAKYPTSIEAKKAEKLVK